jgi:hypothetical protein
MSHYWYILVYNYGLNFTNGIFFDDRHLSHTHSAYTSAVNN